MAPEPSQERPDDRRQKKADIHRARSDKADAPYNTDISQHRAAKTAHETTQQKPTLTNTKIKKKNPMQYITHIYTRTDHRHDQRQKKQPTTLARNIPQQIIIQAHQNKQNIHKYNCNAYNTQYTVNPPRRGLRAQQTSVDQTRIHNTPERILGAA